MATRPAKGVGRRPRRGGRVTVPAGFRRELGIDEVTTLRLTVADEELRLWPVEKQETNGGSWFRRLYDDFAPARAEAIEKGYTEEEINGWIDEAVAAVRGEHG